MVAEAKDYTYLSLDAVLDKTKQQRFLMLDEVQDPHNLGAVLRSVEATGYDGVIMSNKHQVP